MPKILQFVNKMISKILSNILMPLFPNSSTGRLSCGWHRTQGGHTGIFAHHWTLQRRKSLVKVIGARPHVSRVGSDDCNGLNPCARSLHYIKKLGWSRGQCKCVCASGRESVNPQHFIMGRGGRHLTLGLLRPCWHFDTVYTPGNSMGNGLILNNGIDKFTF